MSKMSAFLCRNYVTPIGLGFYLCRVVQGGKRKYSTVAVVGCFTVNLANVSTALDF